MTDERPPLTRPEGMPDWIWEIAYDHADQLWNLFGCDEVKRDRVTVAIGEAIVHAFANVRTSGDAFVDVMGERDRQVLVEGWSQEHDDQYKDGELAFAASCYANHAAKSDRTRAVHERQRALPENWPWGERWFKPKDRRHDLVRAAALLVAEIERLDRASAKGDAS